MLFSQGADIITQHTDSTAPLQIATEQGQVRLRPGLRHDCKFAPNAQLTAIVDDWSGYYIDRVKAVMDGTWKSEDTWGGIDSGMVGMAPMTNMPDDVAKMAMETTEAIRTRCKLNPFTGPITKQDGTVVGEAGKPLPDGDVLGMNWYVKGIDDKLPN